MTINPKDTDSQVEQILKNFDFDKVQKVMNYLRWTWWGRGVPTVAELRSHAEHMLRSVAREPGTLSTNSGGFQARKFKNELGEKYLILEFILVREDGEFIHG